MKKFNTVKLALALTLLVSGLNAMTANASGSFSNSSRSSLQFAYNAGKAIYHRKVSCSECPLPSKKLSKSSAKKVIKSLETQKDLMASLTKKERASAVFYLKNRYRIK